MTKIMIDAGHGGADPGAVYNGRQEKDDNLNLALAVGRILEEDGYEVEYTRTKDLYQTPYEKAELGNGSGADLFVSIHRNSSVFPDQYSGVETLVFDNSGQKARAAANINERLEQLGFRKIGVIERPNLVVLNSTDIPAILVEAGFINNSEDNRLFDQQFDAIARAIAKGIEDAYPAVKPEVYYRVQTGMFKNRDNAERMLYRLQADGFPVFLTYRDGLFRVQVGAFRELENAVQMEQRLRRRGYETWIVSE